MKRLPIRPLVAYYRKIRPAIKKRLAEFRRRYKAGDEEIFLELCFCILTANANALKCDEAIKELKCKDLLLRGKAVLIRSGLKGRVRFHNKKAGFIIAARKVFRRGNILDIKKRLEAKDIIATRDWLVDNIKGYGYKEASHFLRNIGLGGDIAILDRHILKNLKRYGVIRSIPPSVGSRKIYMEIENRMRKFSKHAKIPLKDLDLLFWSMQTGFIFK